MRSPIMSSPGAPRFSRCGCRSARCRTPAKRRVSGFGLYGLLYDYVPGFNGVRVPARYAMIAGLFLAMLAGLRRRTVIAALRYLPFCLRRRCRHRLLILVEGAAIPLEIEPHLGPERSRAARARHEA